MAHEFKGYTPESQLKFQNSWEIADGQSLGEMSTSIRLTVNKRNCLNSDGNEVKSWVVQINLVKSMIVTVLNECFYKIILKPGKNQYTLKLNNSRVLGKDVHDSQVGRKVIQMAGW